MHSGYTGHIMPAEWRWVILMGSGLVLLAFVPFIWIVSSGVLDPNWQFMGVLHNFPDGASYLAKMLQGGQGVWLVHFQHTPESHGGVFFQLIYPLLGQVARLIGLPAIIMFHVARVGAALLMYMAIYQLAAAIWMRLRTRRLFFVLVSLGAGFGWLFSPLLNNTTFPDLSLPEAFPFYGTLVSIHFPLTVACLALLAAIVIDVFRPGANQDPGIHNGGLMAGVVSFLLGFLYPEASVLFNAALAIYIAVYCLNQRRIVLWAGRWLFVTVMSSLPPVILYSAFLTYNPAMVEWNRQTATTPPSPLIMILGFGLPLIMALPGIYRAFRRFDADGDQFVLVWLVAMIVMIYLPTNIQKRFAVGMMVPVAYFATRSLEDFWFQYVNRRWRLRLFVALLPIIGLSQVLVLLMPVALARNAADSAGLFLEKDYRDAFDWLESYTRPTDVILASPQVSTWLPAWVGTRVVYGHPSETLNASIKRQAVTNWYKTNDLSACDDLLNGKYALQGKYSVRFVLVGPEERALGSAFCTAQLRLIVVAGSVSIYAP